MQTAFFLYLCIWLFFSAFVLFKSNGRWQAVNLSFCIVLVLFFAFFVGNREFTVGSDTIEYLGYFEKISTLDWLEAYSYNRFEPAFSILTVIISRFGDFQFFLIFLSIIQILLLLMVLSKFYSTKLVMLGGLTFLSYFVYFNLSINIIRQGIALPLIVLSVLHLCSENNKRAYFFALLACLFHYSSILIFISLILAKIFRSPRRYISLWVCVSILSALNFFELISTFVFDILGISQQYAHILSDYAQSRYVTGFRIDFFLFSSLPFGFIFFRKFFKIKYDERLIRLESIYFILNSAFIAAFFIPFSDRIGVFSWILVPLMFLFYNSKPKYRYKITEDINRPLLLFCSCIAVGIVGCVSFIYHPLMQVSNEVFS